MILVTNISRLRELRKNQTVIIPDAQNLLEDEQIEIGRVLGIHLLPACTVWLRSSGSHPLKFVSEENVIFIRTLDKTGSYDKDLLSTAIFGIMSGSSENDFVTRNDLVMVGLPGNNRTNREKARQDLSRWFGNTESRLSVLCSEAE
jgi:hypothetical protein